MEAQLKASRDAVINVPNLKRFIEDIQKRLPELDFEGKRLAFDMLDITVWLDNDNIEITGTIDTGIVLTPLSAGYSPFFFSPPQAPRPQLFTSHPNPPSTHPLFNP
jgi:hypothetical protein